MSLPILGEMPCSSRQAVRNDPNVAPTMLPVLEDEPLRRPHLPMTRQEMNARGWNDVDIVFVTGDAYIDHPAFAGSRLGRVLEAGDVTLDVVLREASCRGVALPLGRRETSVLEALLRRRDRVVPRSVLLEQLYDRDAEVGLNAVDAAVSRLRRVLEAARAGVHLRTIRGVGWMLTAGGEAE